MQIAHLAPTWLVAGAHGWHEVVRSLSFHSTALSYRSPGLSLLQPLFSVSLLLLGAPSSLAMWLGLQKHSVINRRLWTLQLPGFLLAWVRIFLPSLALFWLFSDLFFLFGHCPIYCISIFLYCTFTLSSMLAKNAATLVARMTARFCPSVPICNIGSAIAEVSAVENCGAPMNLFFQNPLHVLHFLYLFTLNLSYQHRPLYWPNDWELDWQHAASRWIYCIMVWAHSERVFKNWRIRDEDVGVSEKGLFK